MAKARRRYLEPQIVEDLGRKMVFVAGPRQVGKTTVAKNLLPSCEAWQISATGTKDFATPEGIRVGPALKLLRTLV